MADKCSFCGRSHPQIAQLIEAPGRAAFICNECAERASDLVKQNKPAGSEFVLEELNLAAPDRNQPAAKGAVKTVAPPKTPVDPNFESDSGTPDQAPTPKAPKPVRGAKKK